VGLRNVDARLRQVYGDEHGLVVETNVGAGTLVRMRVPKSQPGRVATSGPEPASTGSAGGGSSAGGTTSLPEPVEGASASTGPATRKPDGRLEP